MQKIYGSFLVLIICLYVSFNATAGDLNVVHLDSTWNGKDVPQKGICQRRGGDGYSPKIKVSKIPSNAASLLFMFTDEDYGNEGGHGGFEIKIPNNSDLIVPSFNKKLPKGFSGVQTHHCDRCQEYGGSDFYNGPCSGGKMHAYSVKVYAKNKAGEKLAEGKLALGIY